jgi:DNA-binding beta-propeller fold protein YncE
MRRFSGALVAAGVTVACSVSAVVAAVSAPAREGGVPPGGKVVARISVRRATGGFALGKKMIWALTDNARVLAKIDPNRGVVVARIKLPARGPCPAFPRTCGETAAGAGAVWVSHPSDNNVLRVEPATGTVKATIGVGPQPVTLAISPTAVWVANLGGPTVSRIDPNTNKVVATIRLASARACCSEHMTVTYGGGAVWATVAKRGVVARIDPRTNKVTASIHLSAARSGQPCGFLAADTGGVWAAGAHCFASSGYGVVTRIDVRTRRTAGVVTGLQAPIGVAVAFKSLWVADLDAATIYRVDPRSRRIVAALPIGGVPIDLRAGFHSIWVGDASGRILRIKPLALR